MVAGAITEPRHKDECGGPRWCCERSSVLLGATLTTAVAAGRRWWRCGGDDGG